MQRPRPVKRQVEPQDDDLMLPDLEEMFDLYPSESDQRDEGYRYAPTPTVKPSPEHTVKPASKPSGQPEHALQKTPDEAVKAYKSGGIQSISDLRQFVPQDDNFTEVYDLNSMATMFLPKGLRTAPSEKELERLRKEKERARQKANEDYAREQRGISSQFGDDLISNGV